MTQPSCRLFCRYSCVCLLTFRSLSRRKNRYLITALIWTIMLAGIHNTINAIVLHTKKALNRETQNCVYHLRWTSSNAMRSLGIERVLNFFFNLWSQIHFVCSRVRFLWCIKWLWTKTQLEYHDIFSLLSYLNTFFRLRPNQFFYSWIWVAHKLKTVTLHNNLLAKMITFAGFK